jgi:hypothetical protein
VALFLVAASVLAAFLPARRATRIDALVALRYESSAFVPPEGGSYTVIGHRSSLIGHNGRPEVQMASDAAIREHVGRLLDWKEAHAGYDAAIAGIPPDRRGSAPSGLPYSPWQLIEHLRITQHDILDFCRNPKYEEMNWPDDYWPADTAPPSADAWDESIRRFREDRDALKALAADPQIDLAATIPHGTAQTYLRELLLVADHSAYHVGELIVVRRLLGIWKS